MADMMMPGPFSIPKLQQLVLMELAYFHAWHSRCEDKEPGHLVGATARSSDDDAPAPAPSASRQPQQAMEIDYIKWEVTEMDSIPWDQLSFSLTGSKAMKEGDVPQHLFPGLCLASEMMMRNAKEPKGMINFFETCKAQIESAFGEGMEPFLEISCE